MTSVARGVSPDKSNRLIFIGAVVLAILAALLVFVAISGVGGDGDNNNSFAGGSEVVVASGEIKAGTKITGGMLELATLPQQGIVDGAFTTTDGLDDLVVRQTLQKGEQLTAAKVGQGLKEEDKTLNAVVPSGKRAVAVEVKENTAVGGLLVAGDRVDIISVIIDPNDERPPTALLLLQDVEVLAVAQEIQEPLARFDKDGNPIDTTTAEGSLSTRPEDTSAQPKARTVTLAVDPEDAPLLALAQDQGTIWLALRGLGDEEQPDTGPVTLPSLPGE